MHDQNVTPHSMRVLLVDDELRLRGILARYLQARTHDVSEAASAAAAIEHLERATFDVVLLDINLPEQTGWDVLRWIDAATNTRVLESRPRVVIVSAGQPLSRRIQQLRPDAVLSKPFPIDALARLIESPEHVDLLDGME